MKKSVILILIFLLTITSVSALEIDYKSYQDQALPGDPVSYNLEIHNNEASTISLRLRSVDLNWILDQSEEIIMVAPGQTKNYKVSFEPLSGEKITPGHYAIRLILASNVTQFEKFLTARVVAFDEVMDASFSPKPTIDPRRGAIIRLNLTNNFNILLKDIKVELKSDHFSFTRSVDLQKKQTKIVELPINLDPDTLRGDYQANAKLTRSQKTLVDENLNYIIAEYTDLKELTIPNEGFLLGGEAVTQTNEGNTPIQPTISRNFGWFAYRFSTFDPEPTRIEEVDGKNVVQWDLNLAPGASDTISYTVNYRIPGLIVIILIVALGGLYLFRQRNPLLVTKRVLSMHTPTGTVGIMKVIIHVKNRGALPVKNVRIVDKIPKTIKAPTKHGMFKPTHVKASPDGTVMVWELPSLGARGERVISYRLEGKIQVLGKLHLPTAYAKYVFFRKTRIARSDPLALRQKKF